MSQNNIKPSEISDVLLKQLESADLSVKLEEVGTVLQISDGVARIFGLTNAESGELLEFDSGVMGVVMNLEASSTPPPTSSWTNSALRISLPSKAIPT